MWAVCRLLSVHQMEQRIRFLPRISRLHPPPHTNPSHALNPMLAHSPGMPFTSGQVNVQRNRGLPLFLYRYMRQYRGW